MKTLLAVGVLILTSLLSFVGCKSPAPPLKGCAFASVRVNADQSWYAERVSSNLVRYGASIGTSPGRSLTVDAHSSGYGRRVRKAIVLFARTSDGITALGFAHSYGQRPGISDAELTDLAVRDLSMRLSEELGVRHR